MCRGDFDQAKMFIEGAIVFFQIRRSWKSWGSQIFFFVKNIGVSTWNKQEIIGWLQYFTEICVQWQPPCKLSMLRSMGVALLVYDKLTTLQFRGGVIQFSIIKYDGHNILPRYLWKFMNPYSRVWWPHNSFIYVCFDKLFFSHLSLLSWCIVKMNSLVLTASRVWKIK